MVGPISMHLFEGIQLKHSSERAMYLQLADAIVYLIKGSRLLPAQKMPPSREFASWLQINRVTVSKAYEELQMQGWLESFVGRGTFIALQSPEHQPETLGATVGVIPQKTAGFLIEPQSYISGRRPLITTPLHLDDGFPDPSLAPLKELYRAYRGQLTRSGLYYKFGSYSSPDGSDYYKQALSSYLNTTRGLQTTARNILSARGTLMALNLVCNALINPGDIVVSGVPGWHNGEINFLHARAEHIGLPVDENGLVVEELRELCQNRKVRMVYVTPNHHYPTTVQLSIDRRLELLRLSYEHGFVIFEDDYDYDFHYRHRPLSPLATADEKGMVIYSGSFSKSFSPAFRMGYLVASENVIEHLAKVRILLDRQGDHIMDNAVAELLNDGTLQRYLKKTIAVYKERRDLFCTLMESELKGVVQFSVPEGGLSVWTTFAPSVNLEKTAQGAFKRGLYMPDGRVHRYKGVANAVRLGFASSTIEELVKSVQILKELL